MSEKAPKEKPSNKTSKTSTPAGRSSSSTKPLHAALGPAAKDFGEEVRPLGKELGTLTVRGVRSLLISPAQQVITGLENCSEWISREVFSKLRDTPDDKIKSPNKRIAWPALQAVIYAADDKEIREMFVNLLASDMKDDKKDSAHPSFVELIKQMTGFEARFLKQLYRAEGGIIFEIRRHNLTNSTFDTLDRIFSFDVDGRNSQDMDVACSNLCRLGLITTYNNQFPFTDLMIAKEREVKKSIDDLGPLEGTHSRDFAKEGLFISPLGLNFVKTCFDE